MLAEFKGQDGSLGLRKKNKTLKTYKTLFNDSDNVNDN